MGHSDQRARLAAGVAIVLLTVGCSPPSSGPAAAPPNPVAVSSPATASAAAAASDSTPAPSVTEPSTGLSAPGVRPSKALVVVEENETAALALQDMPNLASLAGTFGQALNYRAVTHPSLPNYLAIAGGSTFGVTDDDPPADHAIAGDSVFDGSVAAGATAKTYAEAMPVPCALTSSGTYAVKHNPWAYFSDPGARADCQRYDLPAGTPTDGVLHDDILAGTLPTVGLLAPEHANDGHDCSLATADGWLHTWMVAVMRVRITGPAGWRSWSPLTRTTRVGRTPC